jgi:hypothetical protein
MTSTRSRPYCRGQILGAAGGVCVVVISGGDVGEDVTCAGEKLVAQRAPPCSAPAASAVDGLRPGGVVWDPATGLELRCIRGGPGPLVHGGRTMVRRSRARLPRPRRLAEPTR